MRVTRIWVCFVELNKMADKQVGVASGQLEAVWALAIVGRLGFIYTSLKLMAAWPLRQDTTRERSRSTRKLTKINNCD